ncbi:hypothetical protein WMF18_04105 [Sorangium sp. So ce315]|uniref:hypothetical protein n=1 Tax=Sorangium sp. So ce315 TaxID=3133299 RepID=UPI003F5F2D34
MTIKARVSGARVGNDEKEPASIISKRDDDDVRKSRSAVVSRCCRVNPATALLSAPPSTDGLPVWPGGVPSWKERTGDGTSALAARAFGLHFQIGLLFPHDERAWARTVRGKIQLSAPHHLVEELARLLAEVRRAASTRVPV